MNLALELYNIYREAHAVSMYTLPGPEPRGQAVTIPALWDRAPQSWLWGHGDLQAPSPQSRISGDTLQDSIP